MTVDIICSECFESYICSMSNSRMSGPVFETRCPKCNKKVIRNLSAFTKGQCDLRGIRGRINVAKFMIVMAEEMGKIINDDIPYSTNPKKITVKNDLPEL